MNDMLAVLKKGLLEKKAKHKEIMAEIRKLIGPLEEERAQLEESIKAIERVIELETDAGKQLTLNDVVSRETGPTTTDIARFRNTSAEKAFRELIKTDLKYKEFKAIEILELANAQGLQTREGADVSYSYARALISKFSKEGLLESVEGARWKAIITE